MRFQWPDEDAADRAHDEFMQRLADDDKIDEYYAEGERVAEEQKGS